MFIQYFLLLCCKRSQGGGTASEETAKYGALSENGIPTVAANGEALSKVRNVHSFMLVSQSAFRLVHHGTNDRALAVRMFLCVCALLL